MICESFNIIHIFHYHSGNINILQASAVHFQQIDSATRNESELDSAARLT